MRHPLDPAKQHEAADRLGRMVARGEISADGARDTMQAIQDAARRNAPNVDKVGLAVRLHWTARDALREERLAFARQAREQEKQLAEVAERVFRMGGSERQAGMAMLEVARTMNPPPPIEIGEAALKLGRWRAKHGR